MYRVRFNFLFPVLAFSCAIAVAESSQTPTKSNFIILPSQLEREYQLSSSDEMLFDSRSFLWVRRAEGIYRLDGNRMELVFEFDGKTTGRELSGTRRLAEDGEGTVWFAGFNGALFRYNPTERSFREIHSSVFPEEERITTIVHDGHEHIWLGGYNGSVVRIDAKNYEASREATIKNHLHHKDGIVGFSFSPSGYLWVASHFGVVLRCNELGQNCTAVDLSEHLRYDRQVVVTSIVHQTEDTAVFALRNGDLYRISISSPRGIAIQKIAEWSNTAEQQNPYILLKAASGDIWYSTTTSLNRLHGRNEIESFDTTNSILSEVTLLGMAENMEGDILFSTFEGSYILRGSVFESFSNVDSSPIGSVMSFAETSSGAIYVGAMAGIARLNPDGLTFMESLNGDDAPYAADSFASAMLGDHESVWTGFFKDGLYLANFADRRSQRIPLIPSSDFGISEIVSSRTGDIAVSSYGEGLFLLNSEGSLQAHLSANGPRNSRMLASDLATCAAFIEDSAVLVGTLHGISLITWKEGDFSSANANSSHYLEDLAIDDLMVASDGRVYFSAINEGLFQARILESGGTTLSIDHIETSPPIPAKHIYAIEEDNLGLIWLSTDKGLVRLNPKSLRITTFDESRLRSMV